jgi:catechol 2,3-dioxygenase-like lactoylglutathione lyase family enzyme
MMRGFEVKALGEVAIRCADIAPMFAFYRDIIGLEVLSGGPDSDIVFFRIAPGHGGHTSVLALFARDAGRADIHPHGDDAPETGARSSLHHIALTVDHAEQEAAMRWYEANGLAYSVQSFDWIGWRGVFTRDPEGNTVELVAYDAAERMAPSGQGD